MWGGYTRGWQWTGFGGNNQLWDWLTLLLLPAALGTIPLWIQAVVGWSGSSQCMSSTLLSWPAG